MILGNKSTENVIVVGDEVAKVAKINQNKLGKLQYLLTHGLYSDGIGSTIVEITNNALDSIIQSGKDPMQNPVYVYLEGVSYSKYQLRIVDNGLGLDEEEFDNVVMNYLTSTKEDDNNVIGAFGIGAKSWCSISNSANFICRKNGVERNFLVYKGATFLEYEKIYERETTEENGVTFQLQIKDWYQYGDFCNKARQKLCYYDNVILTIDGIEVNNEIYRAEHFQWSTLNSNSYMHFSLKDVYYTIDFQNLGIESIYMPICLRFGLDEGIMPTPSRENIIYTEDTKKLFKDKIEMVALWFQDRYNEDTKEFNSILDAYEHIDKKDKVVMIEGTRFVINSLMKYAGLPLNEIKVAGVNIRPVKWYKDHFSDLFWEYDEVALLEDGNWKKKFPGIQNHVRTGQVVLLNETPVGRFKSYLRNKFENRDTLFVVKRRERKLGTYKWSSNHYNNYRSLLGLATVPKTEWRDNIKEYQLVRDSVTSTFVDGKDLETGQDYLDWLQEEKERIKEQRKQYGGSYKGLNKQQGEITIHRAREYRHGGKIVFDKGTARIAELHTRHFLTVYMSKETTEKIGYKLYKLYRLFPNIKFVWLNQREMKHVKDLHNFKTYTQFIMESRPFSRYVTALAIDTYMGMIPHDNEKMIYEAFPKYGELKNVLKEYKNQHLVSCDDELKDELLKLADEKNLWDMNIYTEFKQFREVMNNFGFLAYFKDINSRYYSEEDKKVMKNVIYVMLKHKKVNCKMIEDFELVPKPQPEPEPQFAYYQPEIDEAGFIAGHDEDVINSYDVWKSRDALLEMYPNCKPIGYMEEDIPNPVFKDELELVDDDTEEETF